MRPRRVLRPPLVSNNILHPTTRLLAWIAFAVAVPWLDIGALLVASAIVVALVLLSRAADCWRLIRRTRVLLATLIVLYAFATPGVPLFANWDHWYLTYEGLRAGGLQAWRLLLMIAALAVLFASMPRESLLAGIYVLLRPLRAIGVPVNRIAVRLWLTLHYAETASQVKGLSARWQNALSLPSTRAALITLDVPDFTWQDVRFVVASGALLAFALW
jgi:energy-coupling factor transporter transmembrane protein EcfT